MHLVYYSLYRDPYFDSVCLNWFSHCLTVMFLTLIAHIFMKHPLIIIQTVSFVIQFLFPAM